MNNLWSEWINPHFINKIILKELVFDVLDSLS